MRKPASSPTFATHSRPHRAHSLSRGLHVARDAPCALALNLEAQRTGRHTPISASPVARRPAFAARIRTPFAGACGNEQPERHPCPCQCTAADKTAGRTRRPWATSITSGFERESHEGRGGRQHRHELQTLPRPLVGTPCRIYPGDQGVRDEEMRTAGRQSRHWDARCTESKACPISTKGIENGNGIEG